MSGFYLDGEGEGFWPISSEPTITIKHTPTEGTIVTGSSKGDGVWEIARQHGFRYSRSVGIYLPQSRDKAPKQWKIDGCAAALREAGHNVSIEIEAAPRPAEEAHADRRARLEQRAENLTAKADRHQQIADQRAAAADQISDMIPMGQPILVGHHSERRHRRDLERMHGHHRAAIEHGSITADASRRAEVAAANATGRVNVGAVQRRIKKHEAEIRKYDRMLTACVVSGRKLKAEAIGRVVGCPVCHTEHEVGPDSLFPEHGAATGAHRERIETAKSYAVEEVRYDQDRLSAAQSAGAKVWGPDDFDRAQVKVGRVYASCWVNRAGAQVVRVNAKSVTVKTQYSWTETIPYDGIAKVIVKDIAVE